MFSVCVRGVCLKTKRRLKLDCHNERKGWSWGGGCRSVAGKHGQARRYSGYKGRFCCCLRKFFGVHFWGQFWDPLVPTEGWKWSCEWGERMGPGGAGGGGWLGQRPFLLVHLKFFRGAFWGRQVHIISISHFVISTEEKHDPKRKNPKQPHWAGLCWPCSHAPQRLPPHCWGEQAQARLHHGSSPGADTNLDLPVPLVPYCAALRSNGACRSESPVAVVTIDSQFSSSPCGITLRHLTRQRAELST